MKKRRLTKEEVYLINNSLLRLQFGRKLIINQVATWEVIMDLVAIMNKTPHWESYDIGDLSMGLVSVDINYTIDLIISFIKFYYKEIREEYDKDIRKTL